MRSIYTYYCFIAWRYFYLQYNSALQRLFVTRNIIFKYTHSLFSTVWRPLRRHHTSTGSAGGYLLVLKPGIDIPFLSCYRHTRGLTASDLVKVLSVGCASYTSVSFINTGNYLDKIILRKAGIKKI